jgi:lipopolysaccharide biosynthesis glycosyltransferase
VELGLPAAAKYFNAGVMLVDLVRWRRERIADRALEYLQRYRDRVLLWDQEALNAALAGRWGELDPRWNRNPTLRHLFGRRKRAPVPRGAPADAGADANEIWIAHYTGRLKPWLYPGLGAVQETFFAHLDATVWAGSRPPESWRRRALARYATSRVRRWLLPLETWSTVVAHAFTQRDLADRTD